MADLDFLVEMRMALLREVGNVVQKSSEHDADVLIEALRRYFQDNLATGRYIGFAAEVDGKVIATGGLVFLERPPYRGNLAGLEGYLMNVYTVPVWRGKGIATAIVEQILACAKQSGARRVWLHAEPEVRPIYEKAGFISKSSEMEILF